MFYEILYSDISSSVTGSAFGVHDSNFFLEK